MVVYECEYTVDSRDIDPWYHCRPSGLMGMLQEAATQAACALHVSRDEMLERYNSFWMLARLWYRLDVPLSWGDTVHIRTWHRGGRGASTYRDFDLFVNGQPVGEAVSTWVLADAATPQAGPHEPDHGVPGYRRRPSLQGAHPVPGPPARNYGARGQPRHALQ